MRESQQPVKDDDRVFAGAGGGLILFLVPSHYEAEFVKDFYRSSPAFCILFLISVAALVVMMIWLARLWRPRNPQLKTQAYPKRGTL